MRITKEILRLKEQQGLSVREIARSCGVAPATVGEYLKRAQTAGISWAQAQGMDEEELRRRLLALPEAESEARQSRPQPDWPRIYKELRRKGVTLKLLWKEYIAEHPHGYGYSQFCERYKKWAQTLEPAMRQSYVPGEKMFVDWAGQTVCIEASARGEAFRAYLFVAVLAASNRIFAEAFAHQRLEAWVSAHCRAYEFFGGVPRITIPDNTKTAVVKVCPYEPSLQRSYQEMAQHYDTAIVPARPRRARDKAKVETAVQIAERQILAPLRHRQFFSLEELNREVGRAVAAINAQPFQKLEGSRDSWFESYERDRLLPLPRQRYSLAYWVKAKVNIDHHIVVDKHFYSVPHRLVHQRVEARLTERLVEIFWRGKRVALHTRSYQKGRYTTIDEHRPQSHQRHHQWSPSRVIGWARRQVGPMCGKVVQTILESKPHPEQGYRGCQGILRLAQSVGTSRMEAACQRALRYELCSYRSIKSILKNHLDQQPQEESLPTEKIDHANIRGAQYYK